MRLASTGLQADAELILDGFQFGFSVTF